MEGSLWMSELLNPKKLRPPPLRTLPLPLRLRSSEEDEFRPPKKPRRAEGDVWPEASECGGLAERLRAKMEGLRAGGELVRWSVWSGCDLNKGIKELRHRDQAV